MPRLARLGNRIPAPQPLAGRGVVGVDPRRNPELSARDPGDDLVLHHQRRRGDAVAQHRVRQLHFPQESPGARVQRHQCGVQRAEEQAVTEDRHAAIDAVDLVLVDHLLLAVITPQLAARACVERQHLRAGSHRPGGVHDAVHHRGNRFHDAIAGQLHGPLGLQVFHVAGVDLVQRRVVPPGQVAPIRQVVLRLFRGIANALPAQPAARRQLRRIRSVERLQIRHDILHLRAGEPFRVVVRHQRFRFHLQIRQLAFLERVILAGRVDHLHGECVLRLLHAAILVAVFRLRHHRGGTSRAAPAASAPAATRRRLVRVRDLRLQLRGACASRGGKVRTHGSARAAHHMTAQAAALAFEHGFARHCVARHVLIANRRRRGRSAQAPDIRNNLPRLIRRERGKRRHLCAPDAAADIDEDLAIGTAARKRSAYQRRTAIAAQVCPVARHASLVIKRFPGRDRLCVTGERVSLRFGPVALAKTDHTREKNCQ